MTTFDDDQTFAFDARGEQPMAFAAEGAAPSRRRAPWLVGLAVAAVTAVTGLLMVNPGRVLAAGNDPVPPVATETQAPAEPVDVAATPEASPTTAAAEATANQATTAPTAKPATAKATAKAATAKTTKKAAANVTLMDMDGAKVAVPAGWTATKIAQGWCLAPAGAVAGSCPISVRSYTAHHGARLDADIDGGFESKPQHCEAGDTATLTKAATVTWGGREAELRAMSYPCGVKTATYVVPTWPSYVMYSDAATDDVRAAMATVARQSQLPAQSRPVRLTDFGVVESISPVSGGYRVVIDRAILTPGSRLRNDSRTTYTYTVTNLGTCRHSDAQLSSGELVKLASTDGRKAEISWCHDN